MGISKGVERIALFADAVVAISITLLVIEIHVPDGAAEMTDVQLWAALLALAPDFAAFALSFLVVGVFWMNHRRKFEAVTRISQTLVWINTLFLLAIALVPFTTALISDSGGALATALYAGHMMVCALLLTMLRAHADRAGLLDEGVGKERRTASFWASLQAALVFLASIPAALVNPDLGRLCWLLLLPNVWSLFHRQTPIDRVGAAD